MCARTEEFVDSISCDVGKPLLSVFAIEFLIEGEYALVADIEWFIGALYAFSPLLNPFVRELFVDTTAEFELLGITGLTIFNC